MTTNLKSLGPCLSQMAKECAHSSIRHTRQTPFCPRSIQVIPHPPLQHPNPYLVFTRHPQEQKIESLLHGIQTSPRVPNFPFTPIEKKKEDTRPRVITAQITDDAITLRLKGMFQHAPASLLAALLETGYKETHSKAFETVASEQGLEVALAEIASKIPDDLMKPPVDGLPYSFAINAAMKTSARLLHARTLKEAATETCKNLGEVGARCGSYLTANSAAWHVLPDVITSGKTPLGIATTAALTGILAYGLNKGAETLAKYVHTEFTAGLKEGENSSVASHKEDKEHHIDHHDSHLY